MMQLSTVPGARAASKCCRTSGTTALIAPIRTCWAPASRQCMCRVFAPEAPSSSPQQSALSSFDQDNSSFPSARQMYIQESVSCTGAELAARLPSMQAAMRARAEATAAALQQRTAPAAATGASSSTRSWGTTAARSGAAPRGPSSSVATSSSNSNGGGSSPYTASANPYAAAAAAATATATSSAAAAVVTSTVTSLPPFEPPSATDASTDFGGNSGTSYSNGAGAASMSAEEPSSPSSSGLPLPSTSNLLGLSATEKLQALQQVQAASRQAMAAANTPSSPYYANAPKTIDVRMYDQLVVAHNKLSKKLGASNAHVQLLEDQLSSVNEDLMAAYELLKQIAMEFGTTSRLAQSTAAAVQFGVDPQDALDKISKLQERLSTLEQAVLEQRQEFGQRVVRQVPVEWIGVASEVKVMGDFDDWTRGHELSAEDVTSDSVYSRFEGTLMLRPGSYRVKFLVDGEWRLAADWPTEDDGRGNTVCVLTVA